MKKNRIFILGIVTMFVAILSLTLVSGTLARYTSTGKGISSVQVALWDVQIDSEKLTTNPGEHTTTFDLFNTIKDEDGSAESDVIAGKIAPGTQGVFSFELTNSSEVTANYAIDYTIDEAGVPLQWSLTGAANSWTEDLDDVIASEDTVLAMGGESVDIVVYWRWLYNVNDSRNEADTNLGLSGANPSVTIKVTFTQVD